MQLRARLFAAEIAVAGRQPRFWGIVARNLIPPVGVFALGWPAFLAVSYFVIETWLFFCSFLVHLTPTGYANRIIVVLIALVSMWLEGLPHHATKYLGVVAKARRTLFRKR